MRVEALVPERLEDVHQGHRDATSMIRAPARWASGSTSARGARTAASSRSRSASARWRPRGALLVTAAIRDITERRSAEAKFRALLEAAPDAMIVVDLDGSIALVNAQAESTFGYSREELVGRRSRAWSMSVSRHGALWRPRRAPAGHRPRPPRLRKDGSEFPVEVSLSPLETEEGTLVTAAVRDITERRRRGRRLGAPRRDRRVVGRRDHRRGRSTARSSAGTGAPRGSTGTSAHEVIGQPISMLLPTTVRTSWRRSWSGSAAGSGSSTLRRSAPQEGAPIDVSISVSPVIGPDGRVDGAAAIARDITERKKFESQLQFLADHDVLTGLFNRRRFIEELAQQVELANRYGRAARS